MIVQIIVTFVACSYIFTDIYLHQADLEEKEKWCSVVEDFCDYCLEKEKITADDIDSVLEHFDYLEFIEYEHMDDPYCKKHFSAVALRTKVDI